MMSHERLTKDDIAKIEAEIEERKLQIRPQLIEQLKEARSHGDLSENFEYYAAKREKNRNESRIHYLEQLLQNATLEQDDAGSDQIGLNDSFTIYLPEDDLEESYRLVTSIRSDSRQNRISIDSPLGQAVRGHRIGDQVEVQVSPSYSYPALIRSIQKGKEQSQDPIRSY